MTDIFIIVTAGTVLLLILGIFITFMTLNYQRRRLEHQKQIAELEESFQKEVLKSQIEMQEQTFLSISQEIHDNVGQILSLARLNMSTIEITGNANASQKVTSSKELLDQAIEDLRDLSKRLNSKYTARQSLSSLLKFQLNLIQKTGVVATRFTSQGEEAGINPEKKLILFRIVQEALNNSIRHAAATTISAHLEYRGDRLRLRISDDGRGFEIRKGASADTMAGGTGYQNMVFRAKLIEASFCLESTPGAGTSIFLELPYKKV